MLISEILFQIFSELDGHVYDTRMRFPTRIRHREGQALRTLAGLARTCRTFKEPALDVLWREITDLFVLIKYLMPDEFLRYDEDSRELVRVRSARNSRQLTSFVVHSSSSTSPVQMFGNYWIHT